MCIVRALLIVVILISTQVTNLSAQVPIESEVRQIVTFSFLPGKSADALSIFQEQAIPLYLKDKAMLSFRGFREVESPIPLDLMVVSAFKGMAGMDDSNTALRALAEEAGTSIWEIYGGISALSSGHTDQFVEMLPSLGTGDPSSKRLTAYVWYQILPGQASDFERVIETSIAPWEASAHIDSATGRFLVSDGWHYLRLLSFESLDAYQEYWSLASNGSGYAGLDELTVKRREVIVSSVPALSVR